MFSKPDRQCAADALTGAGDEGAAAGEIKEGEGQEAALILGGQLENIAPGATSRHGGTAFKTGWVTKAGRKARISDSELLKAIRQVAEGKADDLGGVWRSNMAKSIQYKSDAFEAIHTPAKAMHEIGTIDKETMRSFDDSCLVSPRTLGPGAIKALRESNHVSQPVFARYLNTSLSTVQKWESGAKRPSGMALKLLSIVQKHGLQVLS
ncbi:type II toxin-antitoxin system RelE/ParE family toxin [Rhizobium laguerreae]|uniref:type II toxin-antitoxin system RelE/ParE family toxin n=1 Tax=Rhizobium laguerreae TaxID=1076926 RepID=UPI00248480C3|nr:type II toxin-antitoxin system RelE/ParE family toxin [Rhizobium laguerreae]